MKSKPKVKLEGFNVYKEDFDLMKELAVEEGLSLRQMFWKIMEPVLAKARGK